ncbi:MAG: AI-2E family transporter [Oscillospiraceae bacterium]|jgi:predicted PurR-regulated permease PerM
MELDRKTMKKLALLITFAILLFLGLNKVSSILSGIIWVLSLFYPFFLGLCIAFILNIPMRFFERVFFLRRGASKRWKKRLRRPVSLILTLILVFGIIAVVLLLIIPELARTLISLANRIPQSLIEIQVWITGLFDRFPDLTNWAQSIQIDWSDVGSKLTTFLQNSANLLLDSTFTTVVNFVSGLFTFFLAFIFAIYILLQKEKFSAQLKRFLYAYFPRHRIDRLVHFGNLSNKTFSSFLSCQCFEATLLGTLFLIFMNIFGFPYSVLISVLIAFTALIPIFGAIIGCVVGAVLILVVSPAQALWFVVLFVVLQQLEGNFIYPHVVGSSVGLPSILVLMAVTIGGNLMGIPGMLIFIPLCSILYALLRENVHKRLDQSETIVQEADGTEGQPPPPRTGPRQAISQLFSSLFHKSMRPEHEKPEDPAPRETAEGPPPAAPSPAEEAGPEEE